MTIKRAKELCRDQIGRLPRVGYEVCVSEGIEDGQKFAVYLANEGGRLRVWEWREPMILAWYQYRGRA